MRPRPHGQLTPAQWRLGPAERRAAGLATRSKLPSRGPGLKHALAVSIAACAALLTPRLASATPGRAIRLGGVQAQGPATRSVTAMHHNPAMLGALRGFAFEFNVRGGIDQRSVRREGVDDQGAPTGNLGARAQLIDPVAGGFVGGSFMLDPVAIGLGVYDLSNRYRYDASESSRYQQVKDANLPGGSLDLHHDFTVAIAWNAARRFRLGGAVHFPVLYQSMARDDDTFLTGAPGAGDGVGCGSLIDASAENPDCAERISVRTRAARFNLTSTIGLAFDVNPDWTLGLRFRTRPWLNKRRVELKGEAVVCIPDDAADAELYPSTLARCSEAQQGAASATVLLPRELAVGVSGRFGEARRWQFDANLFWTDRCGGPSRSCSGNDARELSLVNVPQEAAVLPETRIYRGYLDVYGMELWGKYRLGKSPVRGTADRPKVTASPTAPTRTTSGEGGSPVPDRKVRTSILFGVGLASPAVRAGAVTAVESERWQLSANLGAHIRVPQRKKPRLRGNWFFAPGYGLDLGLPTRVGAGGAAPDYDPNDALEFAASGRDINGPGADEVLAGRARPSNAGRVQQSVHTFTLSVGWSELPM